MANLSFTEQQFPAAFKTAQVLPLLKKPGLDKDSMSSYRPISNLATASKVIERVFLNRLRPQLLQSRNFSRLQSAYRHGHSTETALLHVLNGVYTAADQKKVTVLVGLDISVAFDTINHDVLLKRLEERFGVCGAAASWLSSYLTDRHQFIKLGVHSFAVMPCDSRIRPWATVVYCIHITSQRAHQVIRRVLSSICWWHTTLHLYERHRHSTSSQPTHTMLSSSTTVVPAEWPSTQRWQVILLGTATQLRSVANVTTINIVTGCCQTQVTRRYHRQPLAFRRPCPGGRQVMQSSHLCSTPCAQSAVWRNSPDNCMQHCILQTWLL